MQQNNMAYQSYIKSGNWKCKESPSGAHHWMEKTGASTVYGTFRCLHCHKESVPTVPKQQFTTQS